MLSIFVQYADKVKRSRIYVFEKMGEREHEEEDEEEDGEEDGGSGGGMRDRLVWGIIY